jgi:L-alanine-DL-glutamate epimerase-like enolase superfamily enzyme
MKIESVEAFPIRIRMDETLEGGTFSYSDYQTVLVRAMVDGEEGWGEAMTRFDPVATALLVRYLSRQMVGQEYRTIKNAWERIWRELRIRGHTRGTDVEALSGIEIALYDALGHLKKKPISSLFSGVPESRVPVFAGSLFASRGPIEDQVEQAKSAGLAGMKVKVGFGIKEDSRILAKVRRKWNDGMLVADANGAYDAGSAAKACEAFAEFELTWFEEPVLSDDFEGYASLKRSKVRIGAGESWFVGDFWRPLEEGLVGVIEPSVSRCGGIGVEVEVARSASLRRIAFAPMTGMNSAVSLAASLHAASACRAIGVEYNPFTNPLQTELATGVGNPSDGSIETPTGHGLGLTVDSRFVKAHSL